MTDKERTEAWRNMPQKMRDEITDLYLAYWVTYNTKKSLEDIFGRENLNTD